MYRCPRRVPDDGAARCSYCPCPAATAFVPICAHDVYHDGCPCGRPGRVKQCCLLDGSGLDCTDDDEWEHFYDGWCFWDPPEGESRPPLCYGID